MHRVVDGFLVLLSRCLIACACKFTRHEHVDFAALPESTFLIDVPEIAEEICLGRAHMFGLSIASIEAGTGADSICSMYRADPESCNIFQAAQNWTSFTGISDCTMTAGEKVELGKLPTEGFSTNQTTSEKLQIIAQKTPGFSVVGSPSQPPQKTSSVEECLETCFRWNPGCSFVVARKSAAAVTCMFHSSSANYALSSPGFDIYQSIHVSDRSGQHMQLGSLPVSLMKEDG